MVATSAVLDLKRLVCKHKGRVYWSSGPSVLISRVNGSITGFRWVFWSDHKWPFHHGGITLATMDRVGVAKAFVQWLPFEVPLDVLRRAQGAARIEWGDEDEPSNSRKRWTGKKPIVHP